MITCHQGAGLTRRGFGKGLICALGGVSGAFLAGRGRAALAATDRDPRGWRAARWGMTEAALKRAFDGRLEPIPGRWDFGGAYATLQLPGVEIGGLAFRAFFQMNKVDGRLQQVLLERRGAVTADAYAGLLTALERDYGPASAQCLPAPDAPSVRQAEIVWTFPDTTIHAVVLDFLSTSLLFEDPNDDIDPLRPFVDSRRIVRRFLPRRLLLRFHPSDRDDLMSRTSRCVAP